MVCEQVQELLRSVQEEGHMLSVPEMAALFQCRGADFAAVTGAAHALRQRLCGDTVAYAVNRRVTAHVLPLQPCSTVTLGVFSFGGCSMCRHDPLGFCHSQRQ